MPDSIVNRAKAAAQFEHALCFVTKAYESYLMNIAMNAEKVLNGAGAHSITNPAYDRAHNLKLQRLSRHAGHRRLLTAHLAQGLAAHYPPLSQARTPC
jgi:hypothetical protein